MSIHLMFDLETLGVSEVDTAIISLAIVPFTFDKVSSFQSLIDSGFYAKIDAKQQIGNGSKFDPDTIRWWRSQPYEAQQHSFIESPDDITVEEAFSQAADFIKKSGYDFKNSFIWSRGTAFDFPKIEYRFKQIKRNPVNYWKIRDVRTAIDCWTGSTNGQYELDVIPPHIKHHCLHDCALDVLAMQEIFAKMTGE